MPSEVVLSLAAFPSPDDLWRRYRDWKGLAAEAERIVLQDYHETADGKALRYYQVNAINAAVEASANGRNRILLVMAKGTGKTYTAFQIIRLLWKSSRKKRILFLADRNILIDQTMVNDFRPFGGAMVSTACARSDARSAAKGVGAWRRAGARRRRGPRPATTPHLRGQGRIRALGGGTGGPRHHL